MAALGLSTKYNRRWQLKNEYKNCDVMSILKFDIRTSEEIHPIYVGVGISQCSYQGLDGYPF